MRSDAGSKSRRLAETLAAATAKLAEAGSETPRLDAELLLASALGVGRERLLIDGDEQLDRQAFERFEALLERRVAREPVAYILGRKEFRRITIAVDPRVLIPRPETELLVEVGLSLPPGSRVVDVGTGSGAVALALKDERPDLDVVGTDVSVDALTVARSNADWLGLEVELVRADLLYGVAGPVDAVLANLPYVEADAELSPEITRYEPAAALYAGADGLDLIRRLVAQARGLPLLALEIGAEQAPAVRRLLERTGFRSSEVLRDLGGHERVVVGRGLVGRAE
jgi:release factor glutamine methyltransferase